MLVLYVVARALGSSVPRDGYSWPYVWAVCIGSLFWATIGLALAVMAATLYNRPKLIFGSS